MSKTKIKAALGKLQAAAKGAFTVLNEVTEGALEGSPAEAEPMRYASEISQRLQRQLDHLEENARYEGLSEDEIAALRATEFAEALEAMQLAATEKLKGFMAVKEVPAADEDSENSDHEDPEGTEEPGV